MINTTAPNAHTAMAATKHVSTHTRCTDVALRYVDLVVTQRSTKSPGQRRSKNLIESATVSDGNGVIEDTVVVEGAAGAGVVGQDTTEAAQPAVQV